MILRLLIRRALHFDRFAWNIGLAQSNGGQHTFLDQRRFVGRMQNFFSSYVNVSRKGDYHQMFSRSSPTCHTALTSIDVDRQKGMPDAVYA